MKRLALALVATVFTSCGFLFVSSPELKPTPRVGAVLWVSTAKGTLLLTAVKGFTGFTGPCEWEESSAGPKHAISCVSPVTVEVQLGGTVIGRVVKLSTNLVDGFETIAGPTPATSLPLSR